MAANTYAFGANAKLYYAAAGTNPDDPDYELSEITDVRATFEKEDVNVTTRASGGWAASAGWLKSCTLEFKILLQTGGAEDGAAGFIAVETAYKTLGGQIALGAYTGDIETEGMEGIVGDFAITSFSRDEAVEGVIFYGVTAKMVKFTEYAIIPEPE